MKYCIALDIGGTKIEGAIVNSRGNIIKRSRKPTQPRKGKKIVLQNIISVLKELQSDKLMHGIGISIPGVINNGKIIFGGGTLTCLEGLNLKNYIEKKTNLHTIVENDANCFALAESIFGHGKNHEVVLGVIWGTGVGLGIIINNKILKGSFGAAGEFGHIVFANTKDKTLELLSSGKKIQNYYYEHTAKKKTVPEILNSKDVVAKFVINEAVDNFSLGLSYLVNIFNPDMIVLGGGLSNIDNEFYKRIREHVKRFSLPLLSKKLKIVKHQFSDSEGVLGAAALVFQKYK